MEENNLPFRMNYKDRQQKLTFLKSTFITTQVQSTV